MFSFRSAAFGRLAPSLFWAAAAATPAVAQIDITTERYDDSRLGANLSETQLNASNINVASFGKLWSYTVSGSVYAQPLYVRSVTIPGQGTHNVLYVVTMNDVVYAFDADSPNDTPLLSLDLTTQVPGSTPVPINDIVGPVNIVGNMGIESTPYIDLSTNTMYLVAQTKEDVGSCGTVRNGRYCHRIHALDITTFEEKFGGPTMILGSVPGNGAGSSGGVLTFDALLEDQRSSLAYAGGKIFMTWSSHEDAFNYHGWIMSYDATTMQQTSIWSTTPNGIQGGVWMAGRAPVVDANGNVYYMTGNGSWDGIDNFGESFIKLSSSPAVALTDWFTPSVWDFLNDADLDLGGSGPILIPGTDLLIGGGKSGVFYLMHTASMGHESADDTNIVQRFDNSGAPNTFDQIKGGPVYWNRSGGVGPWMYVWSDGCNHFNAYHFNGSDFDLPPASQSTMLSPCGSSGGVLTLSADGSAPGSGVVWASIPVAGDANGGVNPGVLRAFDADNLSTELWNSNQNQARDDSGNWPKFSPPTVVNGRVYLASFPSDGMADAPLNVYGLLTADFTLSATPPNPGVMPGDTATYTVNTGAVQNFADPVHLSVDGLPQGARATFSANDVPTPGTVTMTVETGVTTPLGESALTITGAGGTLTHTTTVGLYVTRAAAGSGTIGVDFVGSGTRMTAIESAGVLAKPNWNELDDATGTGAALFDESGADTGATIAWNASGVWNLGLANTPGDIHMMNGYLDPVGADATITVANLLADPGGYYIYVYADGDNGTAARTGGYQLIGDDNSTATIDITDAANATFDGSFVRAANGAGNYAVFFIGGRGFTLTATPGTASDGTQRAPVNGIQIVHGDRIFAGGFD